MAATGTGEQDATCHNESSSALGIDGEIARLQQEISHLKIKLQKSQLDEESFENDDAKVLTYTGLPKFGVLTGILRLISPNLKNGTLSHF